MFLTLIKKTFDIREGEFKISFYMLAYIFLIIASLLIIKPTVNALFLSELGVENLPTAFLLVAAIAIISSYFYSRALAKFSLKKIIRFTLSISIFLIIALALLLRFDYLNKWALYFFYVWVAIHAVLSASQFWVMANLVYNTREAKRLFGFIGSGAILGGILGGYLTSLLAPLIGNENVIFIAALFLGICILLLNKIWKARIIKLNTFKQKKRTGVREVKPITLIKNSKHLTYLAGIVGVSVIVAKLVDYLYSDFASATIQDPDELTSFFAFWFSTFNLISLIIQLFFTQKVVGIWGVGFSLVLLPLGVFLGGALFFVIPELSVIIFIKAVDGTLKQSIHKSATELLSLPLSFDLKNKTKSFIDVVVDSIATGIAGFILIFAIKGLDLPTYFITSIILVLVLVWVYFIVKVRKEYFQTFRENLADMANIKVKETKVVTKNVSVVAGMKSVFKSGSENQILYMLQKLQEINDKRFIVDVELLLNHSSDKVKTAAIQSLYFLNSKSMVSQIPELLKSDDEDLIEATLAYLLLHAEKNEAIVFDTYLDHQKPLIAITALLCLARESRDNYTLRTTYNLKDRIADEIDKYKKDNSDLERLIILLKIIGAANIIEFHVFIKEYIQHPNDEIVEASIVAAGQTINPDFIPLLVNFLPNKKMRLSTIKALQNFGQQVEPTLVNMVKEHTISIEVARFIPIVLRAFHSQEAVRYLFQLLEDRDLAVRLAAIRALSDLKAEHSTLHFNKTKIIESIYEECKLYHNTLSAMHTQIIVSYRNRKKSKEVISEAERDARASLLELLERRLDSGLERIFKLLGLKYKQTDMNIAYAGLVSEKQEARTNAIEFLDNLLSGELKRKLLPIIESSTIDVTSEEVIHQFKQKLLTELECFQLLLEANDQKLKLAVFYLISKQHDKKYMTLLEKYVNDDNTKVRTFANEAINELKNS
ncbi:HEAT repeat domain-containing protein [Cellulophaga sp. HaHaR_3_176]|uniref:Npt1/Npt2 family nucleotide transporter n=1 Tax=Cellulophaga sp. HaHaR_3_176 TaxID=1942464 RepID=UPI001C1F7755|nr:Npt1/Npt2 family nucleotide transporter [Cellulophaga sp. HaHaR_3_176]QWX82693.1 HEAT repeat domain-containing protein [Cellulophaga sp. HaHaR_3_176]